MSDPTSTPVLDLRSVAFAYPDGHQALFGVDLQVQRGERVAVLGPNGAGKTTLVLHLNGILQPGAGTVSVSGLPVVRDNLAEIRRRVGIVFQDPDDQLFMGSVRDDVAFGPRNLGVRGAELDRQVMTALDMVGMADFADRPPHHLSFGQRRRVAVATVLVMEPEIIVLDEPSSNLDPASRRELADILTGLDVTLMMVTHDLPYALQLCPRAIVLSDGIVAARGQHLRHPHRRRADEVAPPRAAVRLRPARLLTASGAVRAARTQVAAPSSSASTASVCAAASGSWVASTTAAPRAASSRSAAIISSRLPASRSLVDSSASSTRGSQREGAGQGDPLLLPAGELVDEVAAELRQPDPVELLGHPARRLPRRHAEREQRDEDALLGRQGRRSGRCAAARGRPRPARRPRGPPAPGRRPRTVPVTVGGRRAQRARQRPQQRRLAGPRRPGHRHHPPARHVQVEGTYGDQVAVRHAEAGAHEVAHRPPSLSAAARSSKWSPTSCTRTSVPGRQPVADVAEQRQEAVGGHDGVLLAAAALAADPAVADGDRARQHAGDVGVVGDQDDGGAVGAVDVGERRPAPGRARRGRAGWSARRTAAGRAGWRPRRRRRRAGGRPGSAARAARRRGRRGRGRRAPRPGRRASRPARRAWCWAKRTLSAGVAWGSRLRPAPCSIRPTSVARSRSRSRGAAVESSLVADEDLAGAGPEDAGEQAHQGRLARARRPQQAHHLARRDVEVDPRQRGDVVSLGVVDVHQAAGADRESGHQPPSLTRSTWARRATTRPVSAATAGSTTRQTAATARTAGHDVATSRTGRREARAGTRRRASPARPRPARRGRRRRRRRGPRAAAPRRRADASCAGPHR